MCFPVPAIPHECCWACIPHQEFTVPEDSNRMSMDVVSAVVSGYFFGEGDLKSIVVVVVSSAQLDLELECFSSQPTSVHSVPSSAVQVNHARPPKLLTAGNVGSTGNLSHVNFVSRGLILANVHMCFVLSENFTSTPIRYDL